MLRLILAAVIGGLIAGTLDILSAFVSFVEPPQSTEITILQFIASGAIGSEAAFSGGQATALLGLAIHYALTLAMAAIFVAAAKFLPLLTRWAWVSGIAYGALLYGAMTYVIVPLTRVPQWVPAEGWALVGGLVAHCFYVGLPIALAARQFLPRT